MKKYLKEILIFSWFVFSLIFELAFTRLNNLSILSDDSSLFFILGAVAIILFLMGIIKSISELSFINKNFWLLSLSPVIFLISCFLFFLFLNNFVIQNIFWIAIMAVLGVYIYNIWLFYQRPHKYQAFTLENFSWYFTLLTSFFLSSGVFGLIIFLDFSIWWSLVFIIVYIFFVFYYLWWIQKIDDKFLWFYMILALILGIELFLSLKFLPFTFYLLGFWWSTLWFLSVKIMLDIARNIFKPRSTSYFILFVMLIAIILTITTRWF